MKHEYELDEIGVINCKIVDSAISDSGSLIVYGWASKDGIDTANEIVPVESINNAIEGYAVWANIREMHNPFLGGAGNAKVLIMEESGLWIEAEIFDEDVIKKILNNVYSGFSIGYITHESYLNGMGVKVLSVIELIEISVVDRPMNSDCFLEHVGKFIEMKIKDGGNMSQKVTTLTLEKKAVMNDNCFGFVGTLDGKKVRILPYKDENEDINVELALSSINILNSNRKEDIKFLTDNEKSSIYSALTGSLEESGYKGTIPKLDTSGEVETKSVLPDSVEYKEIAEFVKTVNISTDEVKVEAKTAIGKIKDAVKNALGLLDKKAVEVYANVTSYSDVENLESLRSELWKVPWTLEKVLDNIVFDENLSSEDKKIKAIQAFNEAKNAWTLTFDELTIISNTVTSGKSIEAKTIQSQNNNSEELKMKDSIMIEGQKYILAPDNQEQVESKSAGNDNGVVHADAKTNADTATPPVTEEETATSSENSDVSTKSVNAEILERIDAIDKRMVGLEKNLEVVGKTVGISGTKFAEQNNSEAAPLDENDPNFWLAQN